MPGKGAFARCVKSVSERSGGVDDPRAVCAKAIAGKRGRTKGRVNASKLSKGDRVFVHSKVVAGREHAVSSETAATHKRYGTVEAIQRKTVDVHFDDSPGSTWIVKKQYIRRNPGRSHHYTEKDLIEIGKAAVKMKVPALALLANPGKKRGKRNPLDTAAAAFQEFHGEEPKDVLTWDEPYHYHGVTAEIGKLIELVIRIPKDRGARNRIVVVKGFKGARLTMNEERSQLFVEGGDQSLDVEDFGIKTNHDFEYLGELVRITYHTNKTHLGREGGDADYVHTFGKMESNGRKTELPRVGYGRRNEEILISGGGYEIPAEGIDG